MSNDLITLITLTEKKAAEMNCQVDSFKAIYLESLVQNMLESSLKPEEVLKVWIENTKASM
jgi:hypothetical protein